MSSEIKTEHIEVRPIAWWFNRGSFSAITIPVFFILLSGTVSAYIYGGIQTIAYAKVLDAVWGGWGIVCFLFVWPFSLLIPGAFWWAAIKITPSVYRVESEANTRKVGIYLAVRMVVLLVGFSLVLQWGNGKIIGWIANRNPDA